MRDRIVEELDYEMEANAQSAFASAYAGRIEAMLVYLASIMDAGGNLPMFGDAIRDQDRPVQRQLEERWRAAQPLLPVGEREELVDRLAAGVGPAVLDGRTEHQVGILVERDVGVGKLPGVELRVESPNVGERVIEHRAMQEVSLGDFVLSGGEMAALTLLFSTSLSRTK